MDGKLHVNKVQLTIGAAYVKTNYLCQHHSARFSIITYFHIQCFLKYAHRDVRMERASLCTTIGGYCYCAPHGRIRNNE